MHRLTSIQQFFQREFRARRQRKKRELIDDALVERRRLEKDHEVIAQRVECVDCRGHTVEHLGGEDVCVVAFEDFAERGRQQLVRLLIIDAPDRAVMIELPKVFRGEMQRHVRRIAPVEQPRRKAVMLGEREPVPHPVAVDRALHGVFAEAGEEMLLVRDEAARLQAAVERV